MFSLRMSPDSADEVHYKAQVLSVEQAIEFGLIADISEFQKHRNVVKSQYLNSEVCFNLHPFTLCGKGLRQIDEAGRKNSKTINELRIQASQLRKNSIEMHDSFSDQYNNLKRKLDQEKSLRVRNLDLENINHQSTMDDLGNKLAFLQAEQACLREEQEFFIRQYKRLHKKLHGTELESFYSIDGSQELSTEEYDLFLKIHSRDSKIKNIEKEELSIKRRIDGATLLHRSIMENLKRNNEDLDISEQEQLASMKQRHSDQENALRLQLDTINKKIGLVQEENRRLSNDLELISQYPELNLTDFDNKTDNIIDFIRSELFQMYHRNKSMGSTGPQSGGDKGGQSEPEGPGPAVMFLYHEVCARETERKKREEGAAAAAAIAKQQLLMQEEQQMRTLYILSQCNYAWQEIQSLNTQLQQRQYDPQYINDFGEKIKKFQTQFQGYISSDKSLVLQKMSQTLLQKEQQLLQQQVRYY